MKINFQQDKNEIPPSIVNTLETIVNQLDCINK